MEVKYAHGLAALLVCSALLSTSCGAPGYCNQGTFPTFLDDEWRGYCLKYEEHVERPASFELAELTSFLASHPAKAAELRQSIATWDNPAACFQQPRQKLEYRELNSCVQHDEAQRLEMINAWDARAEQWLTRREKQAQNLSPKLGDLKREGTRLMRETGEAFEFQAQMDPAAFLEWEVALREQADAVAQVSRVREEWRDALERAESVEFLKTAMLADFGPRVAALSEDLIGLRDQVSDLQAIRAYLGFAVPAAGKPCPTGIRSRQESRAATSALTKQIGLVSGTEPRVSTKITPDERGEDNYEFFSGFLCGQRHEDKQMKNQTQLCARYDFMLERKKPKTEKKWGDWYVKKFTEGDEKEGVDCSLLK